jgi:hypothetical protein
MKVHLINETDESKSIHGYSYSFGDLGIQKNVIERGLHVMMDGSIKTSPIGQIYQTLTNNYYTIYRFKTMDDMVYRLLVPNNG